MTFSRKCELLRRGQGTVLNEVHYNTLTVRLSLIGRITG